MSLFKDLYQTSQSFGSGDEETMKTLYHHAQTCKLYGVCIWLTYWEIFDRIEYVLFLESTRWEYK
jgi:hypothetical protein